MKLYAQNYQSQTFETRANQFLTILALTFTTLTQDINLITQVYTIETPFLIVTLLLSMPNCYRHNQG